MLSCEEKDQRITTAGDAPLSPEQALKTAGEQVQALQQEPDDLSAKALMGTAPVLKQPKEEK
jgi:hypothetical protein